MKPQRILVRSGMQSTGHKTYMIGVPWQIAEQIPADVEFKPEMTEDGILFRPLLLAPQPPPSWARQEATA